MTISGHAGTWYYKADKAPHTNCSGTSFTSYRVTNLTDDTEYTYTAYSDSACTTKLDDVTFTTLEKKLVLSDWGRFEPIGQNTASLDSIGFNLNLAHLKGDDSGAPHSTCTKWDDVDEAGAGVIALTGLDPNTEYTYRGYEDSACATEVASITFTTLPAVLTARSLALTTASLILTGNRGRAFYYQANTGPHTACTLKEAGGCLSEHYPVRPDQRHGVHLHGVHRQRLHQCQETGRRNLHHPVGGAHADRELRQSDHGPADHVRRLDGVLAVCRRRL